MGQKVSTSKDPSNITLTKNDSQELKTKSQKSSRSIDRKSIPNSPKDHKSSFADAEQKQRLESGDAPLLPAQKEANSDDNTADGALHERFDDEEKNADEDRARCQSSSKASSSDALAAFATMNPNIAELSQLTAFRMMQNFEDFHARIDDMLRNQVNEISEKVMDDNLSEKDFRTISYESLPTVQLVENVGTLKRDSSTYTNDTKEFALSERESVSFNEEKLSCKEEEVEEEGIGSGSPEAETTTSDDEEEATTIKGEDDDELLRLRERLDLLEQERDDARMRLRIVEDRCQTYEDESRCLEASLGSLEEKLRTIMTELGDEVQRSRDLEHQLSSIFLPSKSKDRRPKDSQEIDAD
ncbi:uncharacterized protein LOC103315719 isoform X1 [Nasonia vitripennis]|uniref:Uncharacterized protein n=1 Tax=Nasonia vitripennis TaxID=7425 RepID=A0A7M7M6F0_NASVI|nr:uncharacterized protein LOC103315719 isoform X1 [Nasonia vitripennis]